MRVRTKFLFTVVAVAIAALALSACGSSSASSGSAGQSGSGAPGGSASQPTGAVLDAGDVVRISLDYNAGTGYEWVCSADAEDVLVQEGKATEDRSEGDVAGGALRDTFTFGAQQQGEVVLTFDLVRSWEEDAEPAETQVYAFTVTDGGEIVLNPYKSDFVLEPEIIANS